MKRGNEKHDKSKKETEIHAAARTDTREAERRMATSERIAEQAANKADRERFPPSARIRRAEKFTIQTSVRALRDFDSQFGRAAEDRPEDTCSENSIVSWKEE